MTRLMRNMSGDDVRQWIKGGHVLASVDGEEGELLDGVARVVDAERGSVVIHLLSNDSEHIVKKSAIQLHWPMCGALNIVDVPERERRAVYLVRKQTRQWRRTYSARCVEVQELGTWQLMQKAVRFGGLSGSHPCVVKAAFDPWYPQNIEEAQSYLRKPAHSVAINRYITLVAGDRNSEKCIVFYKDKPVGTILQDQFMPQCSGVLAKIVSKHLVWVL